MTAELMGSEPLWPTMIRSRLTGGRLLGTDGSMWLVRELPPAPVQDARSAKEMLEAAGPAMAAIAEIAAMTKTTGSMRRLSRSDYRPVQFLTWNVPALYVPSERSGPEFLAPLFPATTTFDRGCLLAVRLRDSVGGKDRSLASVVSSVAQSIASGGIPTEDFDADYDKVDAALTRAGLLVPSSETLAIADSWFSSNQGYADVITQVQPDCLHFFSSIDAARLASTTTDPDVRIPGKATVTMATVTDLDFGTPFMSPTEPGALWVTELLDAGALAISVRAKIEPADVTRAELRRQRRKYLVDQRDAAAADKMSRAERDEHQAMLTGLEDLYAENSDAPPTLVDASVVVAINGLVPDLAEFSVGRVAQLAPMTARQRGGLAEMMLCSPVRASAYLHDLPAQTVAAAGLADLSNVGDAQGALLGFTERDRQPALIDPMAAAKADSLPLFLGVGQTGAGKTLAAVWLATQFSRMGNPVIIIDPKMESDLSAPVQAVGGQVLSLDDLVSADGVFDPLRFSADPRVGADLAQSMLMAINPWGTQKDDFETPLMSALHYGVERGATCTGQALEIALAERPTEVLQRLVEGVRAAASSTLFRACVGFDPTSEGLRVTEKLTLIKVGRTHLDLPEPGSSAGASLGQRISLALVRMMVFGSQMALAGRDGVVVLDEAWIFLSAGKTEVERLGRLARSQRVLPMLFTQRVTDATDAGIEGYISRGIIGPIQDEKEALAACRLFRIEATPGRLARITAPARTGNAPNWGSMSALIDPVTRQVERGSVWLYADLHQRVVPVEIVLPDPFLRRVSTNKAEIDARQGGIDDGWAPLGTTPR